MKEFYKLDTIKAEGASFELGYGYSKFVKMKLNGKRLTPILWCWSNMGGIKNFKDRVKEKVFGKVEEQKTFLKFYGKSKNPELNNPFIVGYSSIKFGKSPWGPKTGVELGKVKNYKKIGFSTRWKFNLKKGHGNFTYDIWLTKKNKLGPEKTDLEIMIWLDYNFTPPYKEIGKTKEFTIKYNRYKGKWHRIDFYLNNKSGKIDLDILELIKFCKKKINMLDNYYIRSIELGTEFAKNSEVEAKLYELNMDFERR